MLLEKILEGKKAGHIQRVGIMKVIPIFYQSDDLINRKVALPSTMKLGTSSYGNMFFKNPDPEKYMIAPNHLSVMTKLKAQDHAMAKLGFISPKSTKNYDSAMCIESSQPGSIPEDSYDFEVMPYSLRKKIYALEKKGDTKNYSRLWNDISVYNSEFGVNGGSHLSYFYDKYSDKLNDFIAQFECLPNQIGAIILINDKIVGIEITPSPEYWSEVWKPLIRSCYGSETIKVLLKNEKKVDNPLLNESVSKITSIEELDEAVVKFEAKDRKDTETILKEIMTQKVKYRKEEKTDIYTVGNIDSSKYQGQFVSEDGFIIYASIVAEAGKLMRKSLFAF